MLEGRGDVLVAAVDKLPAGDVIGDTLGLSELPGQGPLACRHHLEREHVFIPDLGRVILGQVLRHRVPLVIGLDMLFMACAENPVSP